FLLNFDTDFSANPIAPGTLLNVAYSSPQFSFGADDRVIGPVAVSPSLPNFAAGDASVTGNLDVFFPIGAVGTVGVGLPSFSGFTLSVYNLANVVIASATATTGGSTGHITLGFPGVASRLQFVLFFGPQNSQFGVDDLEFTTVPAPEPASLTLLGGGIVALVARR